MGMNVTAHGSDFQDRDLSTFPLLLVVVGKLALPNNKREPEQYITLRYDKT